MYLYNRMAAFKKGCPLYHRDVEKTDRQDDNAAIRTHSGSYIAYLAKYHPEKLGQIFYLFVDGELVDAYQNRKISHLERIKMVLRAKFFHQMWKRFLKAAGYTEDRHYVSHQFGDILNILIDGLISLVIIYRDHMGGRRRNLPTSSLAPFHRGVRACFWRMSKADQRFHLPRLYLHNPEVDDPDSHGR